MNSYRLAAIGVVSTFFVSVTVTVLLPMVLFNPAPSGKANIYDGRSGDDAARGRKIYIREGCFYCHSQYVRLQDRGMGPVSNAGDFAGETPNLLGTARTGPDLTNEGRRHPFGWHRAHLINPRALKPGSIMPSFSYLSNRDLDDLVAYIQSLGNERLPAEPYAVPREYQHLLAKKTVDTDSERNAQIGQGLYIQDCASCHGQSGHGNGPAPSAQLVSKPPDFANASFNQYPDLYWFYRISEGAPAAGMPRWQETLSVEQRWYLVAYLKSLRDTKAQAPYLETIGPRPSEMRHTHQHWEPPVADE